jgi:hypothetical protein
MMLFHIVIPPWYEHQTSAVRWNGEISEWFIIGKGTRQGCNISPTQYNLYGEDIVRRRLEHNEEGVVIGGRNINNMRYADQLCWPRQEKESKQRLRSWWRRAKHQT